jgi:hypothetical protein
MEDEIQDKIAEMETQVSNRLADFFNDPIDVTCPYCDAAKEVVGIVLAALRSADLKDAALTDGQIADAIGFSVCSDHHNKIAAAQLATVEPIVAALREEVGRLKDEMLKQDLRLVEAVAPDEAREAVAQAREQENAKIFDAVDGLLDGMGLGEDNFKASDWKNLEQLRPATCGKFDCLHAMNIRREQAISAEKTGKIPNDLNVLPMDAD